jgi:hypothetical protein
MLFPHASFSAGNELVLKVTKNTASGIFISDWNLKNRELVFFEDFMQNEKN